MKLLLKLRPCSPALATRIASDTALVRAMGATPNAAVGFLFPKFFDAAGPTLPRLLALAAGERVSLLRDLQFSTGELDAAAHLEVLCKTTIGQGRADIDATRAAYAADTLHPTASRWPVRLPRALFLTRPVAPDTIAHVDQWTGEYVLGTGAAAALRASGLSGWELLPVRRVSTGAQDAAHLVATTLLPAALLDATTWETFDDGRHQPSTPRRHGLLSYAAGALADTADLARTAEPWGEWRTPTWVLRQSARRWFTGAGLRGWGFRPVLTEGSALHREHLGKWTDLLGTLDTSGAEVL